MSTDIPKHELLGKLLRMTTSDNDSEALMAIRKANSLLSSAGWDWDKLLAGKIRIVADPFASIATPPTDTNRRSDASAPRRAPPDPVAPKRKQTDVYSGSFGQRPQAAPQAQAPRAPQINSSFSNAYPGLCYCCGVHVPVRTGFIFKPREHGAPGYPDKFEPICTACNSLSHVYVPSQKAKAKVTTFSPNLGSL